MLHLGLLQPRTAKPASGAQPPDWQARFSELGAVARDPRLQAFYRAGAVAGTTPLADVPLMALDLETTGLDPVKDGIVSIGLVPMRLDRIQASASRHWILKPRVPLAEKSVTIHGITDTQIETAPDLIDILDTVLEAIAGHVLVVHCRSIERQFLNGALAPRIGEHIEFPVIDTMELEARLYRKQRTSLFARFFGHKQVSIRLAASRSRYHLPRYRPHHALTDALASAELLQAQIAHRFSPQTPISALWT